MDLFKRGSHMNIWRDHRWTLANLLTVESKREKHTYISHAALSSGYVVVAPRTPHQSLTSLRFVCLTWIIVKLWSFLAKQIGEFDWTLFYVQGFIHLKSSIDVSDWWTSHHVIFDPNIGSSPQILDLPMHKIGEEKGWETKLGGKIEILHPQFCELPAHPPHAWREMSRETIIIGLCFPFWLKHWTTCSWDMFVLNTHIFFWRDALSSLSIRL